MAQPGALAAPVLPELDPCRLPDGGELDELVLAEALVEHEDRAAVTTGRIRIQESVLGGLALEGAAIAEFLLRDVRLSDCDLSNIAARRGEIRRAEVANSRLVGFALSEGDVQDLRVTGGTMMLSSFARSNLTRVSFEEVNLREVSFVETRLTSVAFDACDLTGADFRGARLKNCTISGSSLDGVVGVESLRGVTMPWADLVGSVEALAAALGIAVESD